MSRYLLLLSVIFLIPAICSAQEKSFKYSKEGAFQHMRSSVSNIVTYTLYKRVGITKERTVDYKDSTYKLIIQDDPSGKIKLLKDSRDSTLATVFLGGLNRLNILLPDGQMLKWNKISSLQWSYQKDGEDVMGYRFKRTPRKHVDINFIDSSIPSDVLEIICLERGVDTFNSNASGPLIGIAVGLAVVRLLISSQADQ